MQLLPVAIQFLADEYDDTSSTIFPLFTSVFGSVSRASSEDLARWSLTPCFQYKKAKKLNPQNHLTDAKRSFMTATLKVIVDKMKWDQDAAADEDEFDDMDEDDRGAFEKMRSVSYLRPTARNPHSNLEVLLGPPKSGRLYSYHRRATGDRGSADRGHVDIVDIRGRAGL